MTNLASFSLLKEKVNKYRQDYSLEGAGLAFDWLALEAILGLNSDEIEETITDGPMDGGIDAIHLTNRTVHIFNFKYTEEFAHTKNRFPEGETSKVLATVESIFSKDVSRGDVNEALWEKINEIWDGFDAGSLSFKLYLCSNKQKLDPKAMKRFEKALSKYRVFECFYLDQEDLVNKILERRYRKVNGQLTFIEKQYFDRSDGPLKGIVATVAATDLINLVKDPEDSNKINMEVFNDNIRIYQPKNKINRRIRETALSDQNHEFWYLNNGITIVCEKCDYIPSRSPKASLVNFQIVNGGQTTHSLFQANLEDSDKLENVLLLVRICETGDNRISEKIGETTNSQTPVNTRDLHANDYVQKKLEEEFRSLGYFYERKKNQHQAQLKEVRLDNELLGQIYLAFYLDKPSEAKNTKTLVFGDAYDDIFDESAATAKNMLLPYKVYLPINEMKKEIQKRKRKKLPISEEDAFVSRATFHILNAVRYIANSRSMDLDDSTDVERAINVAIKYIGEVTKKERRKRNGLYTHDKFFKEIATNVIIRDHVAAKLCGPATRRSTQRRRHSRVRQIR
jgi:hypothetical protein